MSSLIVFAGTVFEVWWWGPIFAFLAFAPASLVIAAVFVLILFFFNRTAKRKLAPVKYAVVFVSVFAISFLTLFVMRNIQFQNEPRQRYLAICEQRNTTLTEKTAIFTQERYYQPEDGGIQVPILITSTSRESDEAFAICPNVSVTHNGKTTDVGAIRIDPETKVRLKGYSPEGEFWPFYIKSIVVE